MRTRVKNKPGWGRGVWDRVLSIILALAILGALGTLGYVIVNSGGESFTGFYILGLSGEATDYPKPVMGEGEGDGGHYQPVA